MWLQNGQGRSTGKICMSSTCVKHLKSASQELDAAQGTATTMRAFHQHDLEQDHAAVSSAISQLIALR